MFLAKNWVDYAVLDSSSGEKLERWGKYILRRPDPQVIWQNPKKNPPPAYAPASFVTATPSSMLVTAYTRLPSIFQKYALLSLLSIIYPNLF